MINSSSRKNENSFPKDEMPTITENNRQFPLYVGNQNVAKLTQQYINIGS
jgi:hypothetical protein